jgi:hypothetical protein
MVEVLYGRPNSARRFARWRAERREPPGGDKLGVLPMAEVFFDHADGYVRVSSDAEGIVRLMRERGEGHWNDPDTSGFASLYFHAEGEEGECTSKLVFTKSDQHGFHFWFRYPVSDLDSPYYRDHKSYYSCSDTELKERVAVLDSHEGTRPLFTGLFVPVEAAVEVVREFVRSGDGVFHPRSRTSARHGLSAADCPSGIGGLTAPPAHHTRGTP